MKEHNLNCSIKHIPIELASCTCGISNTMTFKQIEKEFDELSPEMGRWRLDRNVAKSFLKRSFIKCLQSQVDFIDDKVREKINLETVEMCDVYLGKLYAYDEIKKSLQAQIKELEA